MGKLLEPNLRSYNSRLRMGELREPYFALVELAPMGAPVRASCASPIN